MTQPEDADLSNAIIPDAAYYVGSTAARSDDPNFQDLLRFAYDQHIRPVCACRIDGAEMYLARHGERILVKRMPGTGHMHAVDCGSWEPPPGTSGLGDLLGRAVKEDAETGMTSLRLGFSLAKRPGRAPPDPVSPSVEQGSVRSKPVQLTMRSLLHLLWETAKLNTWSPGFAGRRSWGVVRHHLLAAASQLHVRKDLLKDRLFVPEVFSSERKADLAASRRRRMPPAASSKAPRELVLVLAEVKRFDEARLGYKIVAKHLPDFPLYLDQETFASLQKRFERDLALWHAHEGRHLMLLATIGINTAGSAEIDEITLMTCSPEWLPISSADDATLIESLVAARRYFIRGLRYQIPTDMPIATAVLTDTGSRGVAMFIVREGDEDGFENASEETSASSLDTWKWIVDAGVAPAFPPSARAKGPR